MEHPFDYEITTVAAVAVELALHHRRGEAGEATPLEKAFAL